MRVVRTGVTRTVILTRRYAIKVPSLRGLGEGRGARQRLASLARGLLANQSEYTWHAYEPWAGLVAPVVRSWLGGLVQVYPRCEPWIATPEQQMAMFKRTWLPLQLDPDPGDPKADSFGWLAGRLVRVDYDMT